MTTSCRILELDLVKMKTNDVEFSSYYELECTYEDKAQALVSWWDCEFSDLTIPVTLSTSPYTKATHWKHVMFYLEKDLDCKVGDLITGSIASRKSADNFRALDIKISYHFETIDDTNMYKLR
jgi:type I protein arginine methyltransferase